ncbi:MAG: hypothetical protein A2542_01735 [Parcubacteria group bacterium RIFOXYD2_FULL_52_8]|nr:MAG: hypothetical protein A2542_01735 [Parcubacteria group bacterium RIFOXYD2_FULL_52_8]
MSDTGKGQLQEVTNPPVFGMYDGFLQLKGEKLVAALYVVTDLFPSEEPLKWRVRTLGVELMSLMASLQGRAETTPNQTLKFVLDKVTTLLSHLRVAHTSSYLSPMNFALLEREFVAFEKFLEEQFAGACSRRAVEDLGPSFSELKAHHDEVILRERRALQDLPPAAPLPEEGAHEAAVSLGGRTPTEEQKPQEKQTNILKDIRQEASSKGHATEQIFPHAKEVNMHGQEANTVGRKENILSLIKAQGEYTIKDISTHILGISEKTIQRDLQALVAAGLLRRKGERRWSRYFRP